jgi:voltage-gated potassium channel
VKFPPARTLFQDLIAPPVTYPPNLLERLVAGTRLPWPVAGLILGMVPYFLLLLLAAAAGFPPLLAERRVLFYALRPVVLTTYLFLAYPLLKRALQRTLTALETQFPPTPGSARWRIEAYSVSPRGQVVAVVLGVAIGWFLVEPWQQGVWWAIGYRVLSEGVLFGLLGWTLYWAGTRTGFLTAWRTGRGAALPQAGLRHPRARWAVTVALTLAGGILLTIPFLPPVRLLTPERLLLDGALLLVGLLALTWSGIPLALLARFRIARAFGLVLLALLVGTLGYYKIEGWSLLDSLYMTVITMTTIGFGEIRPLSESGRIFTIFLSLAAVGIAGYSISTLAAFVLEGDLQRILRGRRMDKQIGQLNEHMILCGAGRVGYQVALEFFKTRTPFVVVDNDPAALETLGEIGSISFVQGDAMDDDTLRLAGIDRARGLVAALRDDKDNAFVVLSARSLNPEMHIVARLGNEENAEKLQRAGANEVVSPNAIGGLRMASVMIRPAVVSFLDEMMHAPGQTLRVEEVTLVAGSALLQKTLGEAEIGRRTGVLVVAVKASDGQYYFNPNAQTALREGDVLIVIGTPEQVAALRG